MDYTPTVISTATKPTLFAPGGVTNGATLLATTPRTWQSSDFTTPDKLPESLDGVSVRINTSPPRSTTSA